MDSASNKTRGVSLGTTQNQMINQHHMCKQANANRLKEVKNLEDLVNFRVRTLADDIQEKTEGVKPKTSMQALRQMCDPLLANRGSSTFMANYPKLLGHSNPKSDYEVPQELYAPNRNYSLIDQSK